MNKYDVPVQKLLQATATELKTIPQVQAPTWSTFVKTGVSRERPPTQPDWWHTRAASVLRKVSMLGPIGTQKLRRKYGSRKNMGYEPEQFRPGSANITRKVLQQLEAAQLIKQVDKAGRKGRVLTAKGSSLLDKAAKRVHGAQ